MEEKKILFNLGSKELEKELEGIYYKFGLGIPTNIEVIEKQEIEKKVQEFENNGEKKLVVKYDLQIKVKDELKVWSVSRKVLTTITEHLAETKKFKIILREKSYEVIPLGLKE